MEEDGVVEIFQILREGKRKYHIPLKKPLRRFWELSGLADAVAQALVSSPAMLEFSSRRIESRTRAI